MKQNFLEKIPSFSLVLIMTVLIIIGAALIPIIKLTYMPSKESLNREINVGISWYGASAKAVEQEVTSKIEGIVSSVKGVESTMSMSSNSGGGVLAKLKKGSNLAMVRFDIASQLKQIEKRLPEGVSIHLDNSGNSSSKRSTKTVLAYNINADMVESSIQDYVNLNIKPRLMQVDYVRSVNVSGAVSNYLDIEYNPEILNSYGLNSSMINEGVSNFLGRSTIIGDVERTTADGNKERITLLLENSKPGYDISKVPITTQQGKIIYLGDIATIDYKSRRASSFYRINGLNTINMSIEVDSEINIIKASDELRQKIDDIKPKLADGFYITLINDYSKQIKDELFKLIRRTFLCLFILSFFVWLVSRSAKYLSIIVITLLANILISVILYYILGIELNIFSLAGIAVSFGIIIDTSIIMVDHYSYYRNRSAFIAILASLLTTIASLVIIYFMPDYVKSELNDFASIVIINLSVSLFVSLLFVPALIDRYGYRKKISSKRLRSRGFVMWWNRFYYKYILFTQKRKWIYILVFILAFGLPFYMLPSRLGQNHYWQKDKPEPKWYETLYNETIGSPFYNNNLRPYIDKYLGGTLRLFSNNTGAYTFYRGERETNLIISSKLTEGDDAVVLNQKMRQVENFLSKFKEIKQFVTNINGNSGTISVEFNDDSKKNGFPQILENKVISEVLLIGGVDWSTQGVSERGFSNSLNLGRRNQTIGIKGYNYERLYEYAELVMTMLKENKRVTNIGIESDEYNDDGYEFQICIDYNKDLVALYNIDISECYNMLSSYLHEGKIGTYNYNGNRVDIDYHSIYRDQFDLWHLFNSYITVGGNPIRFSMIGDVGKRVVDSSIKKSDQSYSLNVGFNYNGSYEAGAKLIDKVKKDIEAQMPVGFNTKNRSFYYYDDTGEQYWLIFIIVLIIFFVCSILFESLRQPLVIIMMIPISFIGTFLTFYFTGVNFGTGGFASLVLLSGLVVNAGIYLINEYNNILKRSVVKRGILLSEVKYNQRVKMYIRSYNHKIIALMLTILSTILGLLPFMFDGATSEPFWFSFALGTIGGLIFSVIALVFFMPILMNYHKKLSNKVSRK